jgi:mono/diheme cytochrome c family protein
VGLLVGVVGLTYQAIVEDRNPDRIAKKDQAERLGQRAVELAYTGQIPPEGARNLLRRDPLTRGQELFGQYCAGCHSYQGKFEQGEFRASDLAGFGKAAWIRDLLRDPGDARFFGRTGLRQMTNWVRENLAEPTPEEQADLDRIARWLGTGPRGMPAAGDETSEFAQGYQAFNNRCAECHRYEGQGGTHLNAGPDFTGYGSAEWVRFMIMAPDHPDRYGRGNRNAMPLFRDLEGPTGKVTRQEHDRLQALLLRQISGDDSVAEKKRKRVLESTQLIHLSDIDRELLIRWLMGDYRVVFGGEPVADPDAEKR